MNNFAKRDYRLGDSRVMPREETMPRIKPFGMWPHAWVLTQVFRGFLQLLAKLELFPFQVTNRDVIPAKGPVLVVCNHISEADPPYLWGAIPHRRTAIAIAMGELRYIPGVNAILWLLGHIFVNRRKPASRARALQKGIRVLEHGGLLFLYPEGKCSETGELLKFRSGAAEMAKATGAHVVVAHISGSNIVKPVGKWRIRRALVRLVFDSPINPADFATTKELLTYLRKRMETLASSK